MRGREHRRRQKILGNLAVKNNVAAQNMIVIKVEQGQAQHGIAGKIC